MSKKPVWTEREAIEDAMSVDFSRSQVSNLRKALSGGEQKSTQSKAPAATASGRSSRSTRRRTGPTAVGA